MRAVEPHPIRVVVDDDLHRSRLTVFFRLLLAIPHLIWLVLWSIASFFAGIVNWFATLVQGRAPEALHRFLAAYVRYATHVYAYVLLAANPFPGFTGEPGSYPVDVEIDGPERQSRWKTAFRLILVLPALLLAAFLLGGPGGGGGTGGGGGDWSGEGGEAYTGVAATGGVAFTVAFLAWFACLVRGRMPNGFRDLLAWTLRYGAQTYGYLFLLTDRYPNSDPVEPRPVPAPFRPVELVDNDDDLRRNRLTVFFRLLLALPHFVWLILWGIAVFFALIAGWVVALVTGRLPDLLHRFFAAYVRYQTHVFAFVYLVANPFPGFTGQAGGYPVDVRVDPPEPQSRWKTLFRLFLAVPAFFVSGALVGAAFVAAFLGWFASLALGRMPQGLRNVGAYELGYAAQVNGYVYLLTDVYPYSGPPGRRVEPEVAPTWPAAPVSPSS